VIHTRGFIAAVLLLALPVGAVAQGVTSVRVLRAAAVLAEPTGAADAVGTVNPGAVLEVLDQREGWYLVRPPAGTPSSWRTGWINGASVEPIGAGVAPVRGPAPMVVQESSTANRKGFIVGFGGGVGMHRAPQFPGFVGGPTIRDFAVVTDFAIGYAPTDQVLIYYNNQVGWTRNFFYDILGVTGVGVTYMVRPTSPTPFVKFTIGGGIAAEVDFGLGTVESTDPGLGLTLSGGWEFARHWSVEGGAMWVRLEDGNNHMVLKGTFNWMFY
jgi:hypothetical protein